MISVSDRLEFKIIKDNLDDMEPYIHAEANAQKVSVTLKLIKLFLNEWKDNNNIPHIVLRLLNELKENLEK